MGFLQGTSLLLRRCLRNESTENSRLSQDMERAYPRRSWIPATGGLVVWGETAFTPPRYVQGLGEDAKRFAGVPCW